MEGVVKFYNREKRFGFITGDDGKDYFFHESGIVEGNVVKDEDRVSFEVVEGERGPKAEQVKPLGEAPAEAPAEEAPAEEEPAEEPAEETEEEAPAEEEPAE